MAKYLVTPERISVLVYVLFRHDENGSNQANHGDGSANHLDEQWI
jgi:hypothetical protein